MNCNHKDITKKKEENLDNVINEILSFDSGYNHMFNILFTQRELSHEILSYCRNDIDKIVNSFSREVCIKFLDEDFNDFVKFAKENDLTEEFEDALRICFGYYLKKHGFDKAREIFLNLIDDYVITLNKEQPCLCNWNNASIYLHYISMLLANLVTTH